VTPSMPNKTAALFVAMAFALGLVACSKSGMDSAIDAANKLATRLVAPLVQKDASMQAGKLIDKLQDRPECEVYKLRLRQVGKSSPYEAITQRDLQTAYQEAYKASCGKQD
jgi:hypothetical protein